MLFLARKNLFEQPLRVTFTVLGVALSVMLILVMWAILEEILGQAGAFVRNTDAGSQDRRRDRPDRRHAPRPRAHQ